MVKWATIEAADMFKAVECEHLGNLASQGNKIFVFFGAADSKELSEIVSPFFKANFDDSIFYFSVESNECASRYNVQGQTLAFFNPTGSQVEVFNGPISTTAIRTWFQ